MIFFKRNKTKIILQGEVAECGLCCLAMIFSAHNFYIDLAHLRKQYSTSLKGMTLAEMIEISQSYNFSAKVYRLELNHISTLRLPAILHWDLNHFVVLVHCCKKRVIIHDPISGRNVVSLNELSEHFTGIALELLPNHNFFPAEHRVSLGVFSLFSETSQLRKSFVKVLSLSIILQFFLLISPQYFQRMADVIPLHLQPIFLVSFALLFIGLKFIEVGIENLRNYYIAKLGYEINGQMGETVVDHLLKLPLVFFQKRHVGDLTTRVGCIDRVKNIISNGMVQGVVNGLSLVTMLSVMFYYSIAMGVVTTLGSLIYLGGRLLMFVRYKQSNNRLIKSNASQHTYFIETLRGIQPIKLFAQEANRLKQWLSRYRYFLSLSGVVNYYSDCHEALKKAILGVELIVVVLMGALLTLQHSFTVGKLYAYLFYRNFFVASLGSFVDKVIEFKLLSLYTDRVSDIMIEETEPHYLQNQGKALQSLARIKEIKVRNLAFKHPGSSVALFEGLSFEIKQPETIVFVAPSGYGKSSLLKILVGILKPVKGFIYINGVELSKINPASYRSLVATVMQDDTLFAGSLFQNICFFANEVDPKRVVRCAKLAAIHEDIMKMPMQYHTLVGDMGTALSGGQVQRVILARALYANPQVLFLDEATSHLDVEHERKINLGLAQLPIIKIMVAHRQETIALADRVIDLTRLEMCAY